MALNTNIEVAFRPVTNQGMKGAAPSTAGPRRQVADQTYYLGILRSKNAELLAEIERLRHQEEVIKKSSSAAQSMDKKTRELQQAVQSLKETLSDHNFAVAKATGGVDVDVMLHETEVLKEMNAAQMQKVDAVFLEGRSLENRAKELEQQVKARLDVLDEKLNAEPERRAEYYRFRETGAQMQEQLMPMQREVDSLQRKLKMMTAELAADGQHRTALQRVERLKALEQEKAQLLEEVRASPDGRLPDEKTKLMTKVKTETLEIENVQKQIEEANLEVKRLKDTVITLDTDLLEYKGERAEKYKELEAKDREMQEFISNFDPARASLIEQLAAAEASIVGRLERTGKNLHFLETLQGTSQEQVKEMQGDLDFKKKQLDYSMSTHQRLKNELELRRKELEKVSTLDTKIATELAAVVEKVRQQEEELVTFGDLQRLTQAAERRRRELTAQKAEVSKLRDQLRGLVHLVTTTQMEPLRRTVHESECHAALQAQEQRIRLIQQNVHALSDFIAQKGHEMDYVPLRDQCLSMTDEINTFLQKQLVPQ